MTVLSSLDFKQAYHKPEDDIARQFYLPAMAAAHSYDRAVGYFGSAIYVLAWPSLRHFVAQGGKIRMICSPSLSPEDVDAMTEGYEVRNAAQGERIREEFHRLVTTPGTVKAAKVLASLIALNVLDIRLAWVGEGATGRSKRLFHDKVGIFTDIDDNSVAFKGSMNETWPGLALDGNLESVDVFTTWGSASDQTRVSDEKNYFCRLWHNKFPGVVTIPLPDVARNELILSSDPEHWPDLVNDICI